MKTYALCPISDKRINERVARLNGLFTVLLLILFVFTHQWFIPAFLAIDFLMRSGNLSKFSPIGFSSRNIIKILPLEELLINAGPKIFAARIGLIISSAILVASLVGYNFLSLSLAAILGLFSFLEAAFGLCVACEIYPYVYRLFYKEQ
ncbi:MAG: DUF4395 domain-containing protein [Dysgonamonadaceae bacterium]|nr:DUF4395 domain-containing protein [Dysgonamonadaceae bacterium]MDD4730117.1 DUF4395 domain-containing protein [Dysgonamonadaceae bacterium]